MPHSICSLEFDYYSLIPIGYDRFLPVTLFARIELLGIFLISEIIKKASIKELVFFFSSANNVLMDSEEDNVVVNPETDKCQQSSSGLT